MTNSKDSFNTARSGISFAKILPREKASSKPSKLISDHTYDVLSPQKKTISPNFNHFKARYRKGQKLPSYMENINNRMTITKLSYEMLKANNYYDAEPTDDLKNYKLIVPSRNKFTTTIKRNLFVTSNQ